MWSVFFARFSICLALFFRRINCTSKWAVGRVVCCLVWKLIYQCILARKNFSLCNGQSVAAFYGCFIQLSILHDNVTTMHYQKTQIRTIYVMICFHITTFSRLSSDSFFPACFMPWRGLNFLKSSDLWVGFDMLDVDIIGDEAEYLFDYKVSHVSIESIE